MNNSKAWYESSTYRNAISSFLILLVGMWGVELTVDDVGVIEKGIVSVIGLVTLVGTLRGRKKAIAAIK